MTIKLQDIYGLAKVDILPAGGTADQVLSKIDGTDGNVQWADVVSAIDVFDPAASYAQDDLVIYDDRIHRARAAITPGSWDAAEWIYSVAGKVFDTLPADSVGVDNDLIFIGAGKAETETFFSLGTRTEAAPGMIYMFGTTVGAPFDGFSLQLTDWRGQGQPDRVELDLKFDVTKFTKFTDKFTFTSGALNWDLFNPQGDEQFAYVKAPDSLMGGGLPEWQQFIEGLKAGTVTDLDIVVTYAIKAHQVYRKESGVWEVEELGAVADRPDSYVKRDSGGGIHASDYVLETDPIIESEKWSSRGVYIGKNTSENTTTYGMDICIGTEAGPAVDVPNQTGMIAVGNYAASKIGPVGNDCKSQFWGSQGPRVSTPPVPTLNTLSVGNLLDGYNTMGTPVTKMEGCTFVGMNPVVVTIPPMTDYGDLTNVTCIGYQALPTAGATNEITLGNDQVTKLRCKVTSISALSDKRDKKDIADLSLGLDFINGLRPVSFEWDERTGGYVGVKAIGFIAQEMLEAERNSGMYEYLGMVSESDPDKLEMRTGELIPILTKAVQELSAQVKALENRINTLEGNQP